MLPLENTLPATGAEAAAERTLKNLSTVVAHRIRSQLACIDGFTHLLLDTLGQPDQRELCFRVIESVANVEHVLDDLHHFVQPVTPIVRPLNLHTVAGDFLATLPDDDLGRLVLDLQAPRTLTLHADPHLLRQALMLLLQNALEAHPTAPTRFRTHVEEGDLCFEIWSHGHVEGGCEALLAEPFYTTKAQHLGLGLFIAERITTAHGGAMRLDGHDDQGVCFQLRFPLQPREAPPDA